MKIAILTQYFLPETGAPQNRLFEMAKGLMANGWTVELITALPNYPTGKIFSSYRGFSVSDSIEGIKMKRYWLYASNSPKALPRIISMLSFSVTSLLSCFLLRKSKPDFLLVESPPLTLGFSGWLLSRFSGAKMIMNISDLWPLSAKELGAISDGFFYRLIGKLEVFLYRRADICTGQSEEIVSYIRSRTTSPVYLLRNGVDVSRFDMIQSNTTRERTSRIRVVYAGLLGVAQGIGELCRAVNFASIGIEFHIYGTGPEVKAIEAFAGQNPNNGIIYCGVMPRSEIPRILAGYDATIVALVKNIYGAVPSKIYESMAAGLPIFFSGGGEGAQIVEGNHTGWINKPRDWQTLKNNLKLFVSLDGGSRMNIKEHCRRVAREQFDRKKQIEDLHSFLCSRL